MAEWATIRGEAGREDVLPVHGWQLNERMYGDKAWTNKQPASSTATSRSTRRRSYDVPPPEGESLELCAARTLPYLESPWCLPLRPDATSSLPHTAIRCAAW